MTDIDKLWGELDSFPVCPECQSAKIHPADGMKGSIWYCVHCTWRGDKPDRIATLTQSELSALVERVRGEAVRDKILNDNFIEQLP